ncbi:MAG: DUF1028 domain-containing protein [Planctomycetota bacterium]
MRRLLKRASIAATLALTATVPARATWSIVVLDRRTGEMAIATSTCLPGFDIERFVPVVRVDYGVAAVQAEVSFTASNKRRLFNGLDRVGASPEALIDFIDLRDSGFERRQLGIVSIWGPPRSHTGTFNLDHASGVFGFDGDLEYSIQGNILTGPNVIAECELAFLTTPGDLGQRMMRAMEVARDQGGDGRCSCDFNDPLSCGSPPASFNNASTNVYMALVRPGDTDGVCTSVLGCANGDYYGKFNLSGTSAFQPIVGLRTEFDAWRASLAGRPDAFLSEVSASSTRLKADGAMVTEVTVRLVDVDGDPIGSGGATLGVTRPEGPEIADVRSVVDNGDGTYTVELEATSTTGTARFAITADDGVRPVQLSPMLELESVAPEALHVGRGRLTGIDPEPLEMLVEVDAALAGLPYRIFGSFSGSSPGTVVGSVLVPLNRDRLFDMTAGWMGATPFMDNAGLLDGSASASGLLDLPTGSLAAFVGVTMSYAALIDGTTVTNVATVVIE